MWLKIKDFYSCCRHENYETEIRNTDMGLSSSQARLLNLTARMHQIEYKAAKLEAQKLQMANESTRVYEDYLEALDKTKVQYKVLTTDGSVTYRDIQQYSDFTGAGYALHYKGITFDGQTKYKEGSDGNFYKTGATLPNGVTLQGAEKNCKLGYIVERIRY